MILVNDRCFLCSQLLVNDSIIFAINVHVDENGLHLVRHFIMHSSLYIIKVSHMVNDKQCMYDSMHWGAIGKRQLPIYSYQNDI